MAAPAAGTRRYLGSLHGQDLAGAPELLVFKGKSGMGGEGMVLLAMDGAEMRQQRERYMNPWLVDGES